MNHIRLLQRKDGKWEFVEISRDGTRAAGYCHGWLNWPKDFQERFPVKYAEYVAEREKYHSDGHQTPEDAAACYQSYLLDHSLDLMQKDSSGMHKCVICKEWTQFYATLGGFRIWALCEDHNNRESVETLYEITPDTEIWTS